MALKWHKQETLYVYWLCNSALSKICLVMQSIKRCNEFQSQRVLPVSAMFELKVYVHSFLTATFLVLVAKVTSNNVGHIASVLGSVSSPD